ncbi:SusF/SusE family outer membrane protein [Gillisia marina]|uniref:SusF/SusE family outer membrane protein n=1 Tax=Gillisia marina TaxID=1167637 RepID=UPI00029B5471|nr:SusF/SusE family outer membrane protein [Gillisia marina]
MKKILILLFAFVSLLGLNSCSSDDDVVFIAQPDVEGINFINSFNDTYVLTSATSGNIAERFVWNTVDFDVPTNITYELQASTSSDFSSFDVIGSTSENNLAIKVSQLITLATDAGLDNDAETEAPNTGQVYFRIKAFAGNDGGNALNTSSEVKSITVVMPEAAVEEGPSFKELYLVGDATAAGWNNDNNNTPLFRDSENENQYYFTGYFGAGAFKLLDMKGAWQPQWGIKDGSLTNSELLGEDPDAFPVATAGYYTFTINTEDLTYTFEAYDASAATTYDVIGIVGAGTSVGWPNDDNPTPDIKMTNSDFDKHIWQANDVVLTDGAAKFRANLAWDVNWGGGENFPSGQATGDDIMVQAGTYTVWFNDITSRYTFIPVVVAE